MKRLPSRTAILEAEISTRLAYVETIQRLKKDKRLERSGHHLDSLIAAMTQQYRTMVVEERSLTSRLENLSSQMQPLRTRLRSLTSQRFEEERRHMETIMMLAGVTSRRSSPPPVSTNLAQPGRGVFFSSLMSLSGHLVEYCSGAQGSLLVMDRIRHGSSRERNLLWSELGLPTSLISILLTGNDNFIKVVLVLAQVDREKRVVVKREISKSRKNFEKINARFLENIEKLVE